ncbi:hypothetical protein HK100_012850 [Physocladia obscura]|uniref:RCK N-terminal domain-containing protein n=1 Tax=Physocladia obscura TaxID=109957 RepID=A0AAD5SZ57_9FUNG|nr:hypothetical protein HK100_012850 [Physocladia obscura]
MKRAGSVPLLNQEFILGYPVAPYQDSTIPQCKLLAQMSNLDDLVVQSASDWIGHVLVCTGSFDLFKFVCGMRSSHLEFHYRILFLANRKPTPTEFETLSMFPEISYIVGDPRSKKVLLNAGLRGCTKVAVVNMGTYSSGEFAGSEAIMISYLIHHMFKRGELLHHKNVIIEVTRRPHISYLQPSPTTTHRSYKKIVHNALQKISRSVVGFGSKNIENRENKRGSLRAAFEKNIAGEVPYFYTPVFAAGRVVSASMLDSILFQLYKSPWMLEIILLMCGVDRNLGEGVSALFPGATKSWIGQISVPESFVGKTYGELYEEMCGNQGIVPMGIYRAISADLKNKLPYVYTNPMPGVLLMEGDLLFILAP